MKKEFQINKGFTLIELLAVMVVLVVIGGIITRIFFASLRGTNKLNNLTTVRQAGNLTSLQITKLLEFAKELNVPDSCTTPVATSSVTVTQLDDSQVTLTCDAGTIASNGASLIDTSLLTMSDCYFVCSQQDAFISPTVSVNFTLQRITRNSLVENQVSIPFQSSTNLQNIH